ncbi:serine/threonine-protein kinase [uncultured Microscilla sp.]|uniref:serine/threonine protein kinase n=1 Tax=uncultured Microscilla sp. TaxID=432653 RepID=UPI0026090061|nr:serine/threonine-protein kinase [uncultured Microscilla sp.]
MMMRVGDRYEYDPEHDTLDKKGLGTVYRAVDTQENRVVALKCISPDLLPAHYDLAEEIERVKYHSDENLVRYYDVFEQELPVDVSAIPDNVLSNTNIEITPDAEDENTLKEETLLFHIVVMEYVEGKTLNNFPIYNLTEESLQHLLRDILSGLHYLHNHRIIHRDLRQAKVIIKEENGGLTPKILYFGLSAQLSQYMSNYGYLPPERLGKYDERITEMSDIWMFGVLVYELLTNQLPFGSTQNGTTNDVIMANILSDQMQGDLNQLIPPYNAIVQKCLANDPDQRYQQVAELLELFPKKTDETKYSAFETTKGFGDTAASLGTTQEEYDKEIYGTTNVDQVTIGDATFKPADGSDEQPASVIKPKSMFDTLDEVTDFEEAKEKRTNKFLIVALILSVMLSLFVIYFLTQYGKKKLDYHPVPNPAKQVVAKAVYQE